MPSHKSVLSIVIICTDPPGPPESLVSANTETSAVVQWGSPAITGGSGATISEYTVTVDGQVYQTISHHDGRDVFTTIITGLDYNTRYTVNVSAINSCGLSSEPATTEVFISEGKCKWKTWRGDLVMSIDTSVVIIFSR